MLARVPTATLIVALLAPTMSACGRPCTGKQPYCDDKYPRGRAAVHLGGRWVGERAVWADATGTLRGEIETGPDWSIAALADLLVIGAPADRSVRLSPPPTGTEYLDTAQTGTWQRSEPSFGQVVSVAPGGDSTPRELWVGAPEAVTYRGVVFRYPDALANPGEDPVLLITGASPGDRTGSVIAPCGDLTGDGRTDWLISAPHFSQPIDQEELTEVADLAGAVFLLESEVYLQASGSVALSDVAEGWWGSTTGEGVGSAADCSNDVTGDGVNDLVVGAPMRGGERPGRVYVLDGAALPASGPIATAAWWTLEAADPNAWYGAAVATGDLNGDGLFEIIVGEPGAAEGIGRAAAYDGADVQARLADIAPATTFELLDRPPGDHFGTTIAAGRINNDVYWDVAIGAPDWATDDSFDAGRLFLWEGSPSWPATEVAGQDNQREIVGSEPFQRVGLTITLADIDKDGNDDLLLTTRDRASP